MKVVHFNSSRSWGGGEQQILHLMTRLRGRGVKSTLIAHPDSELLRRSVQEAELDVHGFATWSTHCPLAARRLRAKLRELGADVLHLHDGRAAATGIPAARGLPRMGLVLHRRNSSPMPRNPLSRRRNGSARVDAYVAVSESARASLRGINVADERICVIPSGIDVDQLLASADRAVMRAGLGLTPAPLIGTVSALNPKKDVGCFVAAAGRLARADPELQFIVVGDGRERRALETQASELGLGDRMRFTGQVRDAHRLIAAMDVFVFPSLAEGSPGVVKEAMALGVPVVAAAAPGTVEVVTKDTGLLVPCENAEQLARAVRGTLDAPEPVAERVQRARVRARERFSIDATVARTHEVYRRVMGTRQAAGVGS